MIDNEVVSGQQSAWSLVKKLGEGDAGEVYLVESLMEARQAILKRPHRSAFSSDVLRQAAQIKTEGLLLRTLHAFLTTGPVEGVRVPNLIDQSKPGSDYSDRLFIVIEQAPGLDLGTLARASRMGAPAADLGLRAAEQSLLDTVARAGKVPERLILHVLITLMDFLDQAHSQHFQNGAVDAWGIIWNDVKPDHLFWDPSGGTLTIIDWGNGQFIESDGTTKDRRYSRIDDDRQFIEEMSRFLTQFAPELNERLRWPDQAAPDNISADGRLVLRTRLLNELDKQDQALDEARELEVTLLQKGSADNETLEALEAVQKQILSFGQMPDFSSALDLAASAASMMIDQGRLDGLAELCAWAAGLPSEGPRDWPLVDRLAHIAASARPDQQPALMRAIQASVCADWPEVLWNLLESIQNVPEPDWWYDISTLVRGLQVGADADSVRPLLTVNRFSLSLQAAVRQLQDRTRSEPVGAGPAESELTDSPEADQLRRVLAFSRRLKDEIVPNWVQLEPDPPHASLVYSDIDGLLDEAAPYLPNDEQAIRRVLAQPKAQIRLVLDAWERRDWLTAGKALRQALVWDPDRRRVLRADQAVQAAPGWLERAHLGPERDMNLSEFITHLEFEGRQLRNSVGPAGWIDAILEGLKSLRRGTWPADLLAAQPLLSAEMPWLRQYQRGGEALLPEADEIGDKISAPLPAVELRGVREARLGPRQEMTILRPLDTWAPEARGSSARVYRGVVKTGEKTIEAAVKVMRMDKIDYALPLFREEVLIMPLMKDVPGITPMLECGFIWLEGEGEDENRPAPLPPDGDPDAVANMHGKMVRIGPDSPQSFLSQLDARVREGWMPYLVLEQRDDQHNLLALCDAGRVRGNFRPLGDLVQMAIQICDIIQAAHERNIVYRDHKILHYYWIDETHGIYVIDWNVARLHPDGLTEVEKQMDLVQFGARGLHHILTGRAAPGALPLGPTRPDEIEQAAQTYQTQWTFDDRRLSQELKDLLERVLGGSYCSAAALRDDLKRAYMLLPAVPLG